MATHFIRLLVRNALKHTQIHKFETIGQGKISLHVDKLQCLHLIHLEIEAILGFYGHNLEIRVQKLSNIFQVLCFVEFLLALRQPSELPASFIVNVSRCARHHRAFMNAIKPRTLQLVTVATTALAKNSLSALSRHISIKLSRMYLIISHKQRKQKKTKQCKQC